MTLRGIPQGGVPVGMQNAVNGTPTLMNLTSIGGGNAQGAALVPSDLVIIGTAGASNLAVTLPDPNKYGGAFADSWLVINGQSGQTVNVFPPTGGNIDGTGANASVAVAQGATATFYLQSFTASSSVWIADGGS